jgi:hypothetical protein
MLSGTNKEQKPAEETYSPEPVAQNNEVEDTYNPNADEPDEPARTDRNL